MKKIPDELYKRFPERLEFRWSISRAEGTYGQNRLTLRLNSKLIASALGGNYDMEGYCLGEFIQKELEDFLMLMPVKELYGLKWENPHAKNADERYSKTLTGLHNVPLVDGSSGFSSMKNILGNMGLGLHFERKVSGVEIYSLFRKGD